MLAGTAHCLFGREDNTSTSDCDRVYIIHSCAQSYSTTSLPEPSTLQQIGLRLKTRADLKETCRAAWRPLLRKTLYSLYIIIFNKNANQYLNAVVLFCQHQCYHTYALNVMLLYKFYYCIWYKVVVKSQFIECQLCSANAVNMTCYANVMRIFTVNDMFSFINMC